MTRTWLGKKTNMTLRTFSVAHHLPPEWVELRERSEQIAARNDFWYRRDLQDEARQLAMRASDILVDATQQVRPRVFPCAGCQS
jgi:hypothetical protein